MAGHGGKREGAGRKSKPDPALFERQKPGPTSGAERECYARLIDALNRPAGTEKEDSYEIRQWRELSEAQDLRIRLDTRKYLYDHRDGKAAEPFRDETPPPIQINISALPMKRQRA